MTDLTRKPGLKFLAQHDNRFTVQAALSDTPSSAWQRAFQRFADIHQQFMSNELRIHGRILTFVTEATNVDNAVDIIDRAIDDANKELHRAAEQAKATADRAAQTRIDEQQALNHLNEKFKTR